MNGKSAIFGIVRPMRLMNCLLFSLVIAACSASDPPALVDNTCIDCHAVHSSGFVEGHAFAEENCTICHAGVATAADEASAHAGLIAFPGDIANAEAACGNCHADRVASVTGSLMNTGRGIVHTTRLVIDGHADHAGDGTLATLGDTVADSMLRKQCASCHLGHPKTVHAVNETTSRGGGCLACHIAEHPQEGHPALTSEVSDARCFGCHSRSGRISLSYAGLAEVDESDLRLADGRTVARMPGDVHHAAGMRCKDCHNADDVMGHAGSAIHQREAVAANCTDCHETHEDDPDHARLTCATCHSQWAPQCFGCHMEFDEDAEQWDHIEQMATPGRWSDRRWDVRNTLPALGVNADGRIDVFVPGMIMTVAHPSWDQERFVRLFAPLSPHTTGPSRSCESCHRSSEALGLGAGILTAEHGALQFTPAGKLLEDGLPADAWTDIGNTLGARTSRPGARPLTKQEKERVFGVVLQQDSSAAGGSASSSMSSSTLNTGGTKDSAGRSAAPSPRSPTK